MSGAGSELSAEVVERMVALVHDLADNRFTGFEWHDEAINLAALLPEPVDPDFLEARELARPWLFYDDVSELCADQPAMKALVAAIKRGRELAQKAPSHAA